MAHARASRSLARLDVVVQVARTAWCYSAGAVSVGAGVVAWAVDGPVCCRGRVLRWLRVMAVCQPSCRHHAYTCPQAPQHRCHSTSDTAGPERVREVVAASAASTLFLSLFRPYVSMHAVPTLSRNSGGSETARASTRELPGLTSTAARPPPENTPADPCAPKRRLKATAAARGASRRAASAHNAARPPHKSPRSRSPGPRHGASGTVLAGPQAPASCPAPSTRRQCSKSMLEALIYFLRVRAVLSCPVQCMRRLSSAPWPALGVDDGSAGTSNDMSSMQYRCMAASHALHSRLAEQLQTCTLRTPRGC